jgi:hypothetical protein
MPTAAVAGSALFAPSHPYVKLRVHQTCFAAARRLCTDDHRCPGEFIDLRDLRWVDGNFHGPRAWPCVCSIQQHAVSRARRRRLWHGAPDGGPENRSGRLCVDHAGANANPETREPDRSGDTCREHERGHHVQSERVVREAVPGGSKRTWRAFSGCSKPPDHTSAGPIRLPTPVARTTSSQ